MTTRHVLGISGGKDSAALAVFMKQYHPELAIQYFFTDTGKELPEVYEFLGRLEGFLGAEINRLNPDRDFDFWLRQYGHFLPSPRTRWCTRQLKLLPFRHWIKPWLEAGDTVISYVAIRADEDHREGYTSTHERLEVRLPFREKGIDRERVIEILRNSGLGLSKHRSNGRKAKSKCLVKGRPNAFSTHDGRSLLTLSVAAKRGYSLDVTATLFV